MVTSATRWLAVSAVGLAGLLTAAFAVPQLVDRPASANTDPSTPAGNGAASTPDPAGADQIGPPAPASSGSSSGAAGGGTGASSAANPSIGSADSPSPTLTPTTRAPAPSRRRPRAVSGAS
jgi:hypothetical protein